MRSRFVSSVVTLVVVVAACSSTEGTARSHPATTRLAGTAADWSTLQNPIYAPTHMVKDISVQLVDGRWFLYGSEKWEPNEADDRHALSSTDLVHWQPIPSTQAVEFNSPDLTRQTDDTWLMTHQRTFTQGASAVDRIVVSTAPTLEGPRSDARETLLGQFPGQRLLDGAVAHTRAGLYLVAKRGARDLVPQLTEMFRSPSGSIDGPWQYVGTADVGWTENFQLLKIDGVWHLLVTTIPVHAPVLFAMSGNPNKPESWLHWRKVATLTVPPETWNSPAPGNSRVAGIGFERANSAYLYDARGRDGFFYLFYAGSDELTTHDGRGLAHIGVARSRNLETWTVPGPR